MANTRCRIEVYMSTGVAGVLTALATMAVVSGLLVALVMLLDRVPHDTQ
jgi:hypothetical protein